jgi:hypothetical protein
MSFLARTGQWWKVMTFLILFAMAGIFLALMVWRINDSTSVRAVPGQIAFALAGTATGLAALLWLWFSIRCPRCGTAIGGELLKREPVGRWLARLFELTECPICRFTGRP